MRDDVVELSKTLNIANDEIPETPYLQARQEWDNRIGSTVIQAKNWRITALGLLVLSIVLAGGLIAVALNNKHIPYIIEVGKGQVKNIAKLDNNTSYKPNEHALKYHLSRFVEKIRSVSLDNAVNKKWIFEAYAMLTPKTANKLDEYFLQRHDSGITNKLEESTTFVTVTAFTKVANNTYQLQWQEDTHNDSGKLLDSSKWVGFATITISPPTSEQSILQNPLGIWLTDFTWSKAAK